MPSSNLENLVFKAYQALITYRRIPSQQLKLSLIVLSTLHENINESHPTQNTTALDGHNLQKISDYKAKFLIKEPYSIEDIRHLIATVHELIQDTILIDASRNDKQTFLDFLQQIIHCLENADKQINKNLRIAFKDAQQDYINFINNNINEKNAEVIEKINISINNILTDQSTNEENFNARFRELELELSISEPLPLENNTVDDSKWADILEAAFKTYQAYRAYDKAQNLCIVKETLKKRELPSEHLFHITLSGEEKNQPSIEMLQKEYADSYQTCKNIVKTFCSSSLEQYKAILRCIGATIKDLNMSEDCFKSSLLFQLNSLDSLESVDNSSVVTQRSAACPQDPGILNNTEIDCVNIEQTGTRGQAAERRNLNYQQTLDLKKQNLNFNSTQAIIGILILSLGLSLIALGIISIITGTGPLAALAGLITIGSVIAFNLMIDASIVIGLFLSTVALITLADVINNTDEAISTCETQCALAV